MRGSLFVDAVPVPFRGHDWWTALGTWAALLVFALSSRGFETFLPSLGAFLTGRPTEVAAVGADTVHLSFGAAAVVVSVLVGFGLATLVNAVKGRPFEPQEPCRPAQPQAAFLGDILRVFVEELYARWLFLGLLARLPLLQSPVAYYALVLVGNLSWALLHLDNFVRREDRTVWRVLPQFGCGLVYTVVYLNFGLIGAVLVHAAHNMILMSLDRLNAFGSGNVVILVFAAITGITAWALLGRPLSEIMQWLHAAQSFTLPGWGIRDYFCATLLVLAVLSVVGELLRFDHTPPSTSSRAVGLASLLAAILKALAMLGVFHLLGLLTSDPRPRVVGAVLVVLMFTALSVTGSGVARIFWLQTAVYVLALCCALAMPFWFGVLLLFLVGCVYRIEHRLAAAQAMVVLVRRTGRGDRPGSGGILG